MVSKFEQLAYTAFHEALKKLLTIVTGDLHHQRQCGLQDRSDARSNAQLGFRLPGQLGDRTALRLGYGRPFTCDVRWNLWKRC